MSANPIPLAAPNGTVFAYACSECFRVGGGASGPRIADLPDGPNPNEVEWSCRIATSCCTCRTCGAVERNLSFTCPECQAKKDAAWKAVAPEREAEERRRKEIFDAALAKAADRDAAKVLHDLMSKISEDYYFAGWLNDLEFSLWSMIRGGDRRFGFGEVTDGEVAELKRLHEKTGGWWRYEERVGEVFVPTAEWIEIVRRKEAAEILERIAK